MTANIICRTAQTVLVVVATFLVVDAVLPGNTASGLNKTAAYLAGSCMGIVAVLLDDVRIHWSARQRHRAGYRQRHGTG